MFQSQDDVRSIDHINALVDVFHVLYTNIKTIIDRGSNKFCSCSRKDLFV
jgi:hypothetical protein